jgi:hypothetical protein
MIIYVLYGLILLHFVLILRLIRKHTAVDEMLGKLKGDLNCLDLMRAGQNMNLGILLGLGPKGIDRYSWSYEADAENEYIEIRLWPMESDTYSHNHPFLTLRTLIKDQVDKPFFLAIRWDKVSDPDVQFFGKEEADLTELRRTALNILSNEIQPNSARSIQN